MTDPPVKPKPSGPRPSHLINRSEVRKFILDAFARSRPHLQISRVSGEALDRIEYWLREKICSEVYSHPSVGKTFKL